MPETNVLEFEVLQELLLQKKYAEFIQEIDKCNPVDAADLLSQFPEDQVARVFRLFKKDVAAEVFAELDADLQELIIQHMTDREIGEMLEELYTDDAVDMLEEMPASVVKRIMKNATPETREEINRFLAYPEKSAGSVMTSEFIDLRKNMTCEQAVTRIRRIGLDKETVYVAYVRLEKEMNPTGFYLADYDNYSYEATALGLSAGTGTRGFTTTYLDEFSGETGVLKVTMKINNRLLCGLSMQQFLFCGNLAAKHGCLLKCRYYL